MQFVCFQQVFQLAGVCVGNVMSLKSPWAALLLMYPLQFPLSWWRSSFVNDVTFGCPTSDSTQAFKKAIIKFMGGSQLQHKCLAFCSPSLLRFWTVLTSFLLMFSSPSLSHSLYLAQFSFSPFLRGRHEARTNMNQEVIFIANISNTSLQGSNFLFFLPQINL